MYAPKYVLVMLNFRLAPTEILGSCGRSFADRQSMVVDEDDRPVSPGQVGEIKVRGLGTTLGYWNKDDETKNVLYKYPKVSQAAVIGTPDQKWGEIVTAFVVKRKDAEIPEDELKDFCRNEIAGYKVPKKIFFVDDLPMSASGKILKYQLRTKESL